VTHFSHTNNVTNKRTCGFSINRFYKIFPVVGKRDPFSLKLKKPACYGVKAITILQVDLSFRLQENENITGKWKRSSLKVLKVSKI
jgi:hypothetical protein